MKQQNKKKSILTIIGTRPEVIKMAPVINAIKASSCFSGFVCTTSQHRQMQDDMVRMFELTVDYDLDIMKPGQTLSHITTAVLSKVTAIINDIKPDMILVHGDTTTSFAASLASFYGQIPIGHVEAGLRTDDLNNPFPEEANRQLTSRIASLHFAPTEQARQNLLNEGVSSSKVFVTGNTVIDALLWTKERIDKSDFINVLPKSIINLTRQQRPYVLITGHRRESFGDGFLSICKAIKTMAGMRSDWHFVYPVHLNPNVRNTVYEILSDIENIHLIDPVDYFPFVYLMANSKIILTDSGGVQEEAPSLGKPVLVMRAKTERVEGIAAGTARLVGTDCDGIMHNVLQFIDNDSLRYQMTKIANPYGDGCAAEKIHDIMRAYLLGQ